MTNNQFTDEQIAQWLGDACMVIGDRFATNDELSAAKAIRALAVELQERRKADSEPEARIVVIPTIWKHYTTVQTAIIYEKAMTDAGIKWRSIDD